MDAIIEAAAQVLERDGRAAFTTNRVAERAGVSISTLYQYFRDKDSVLIELARREMELHRSHVVDAVARTAEQADGQRDRLILRALIDASGYRRQTRRTAQNTLSAHGLEAELSRPAQDIGRLLESHPQALPTRARALTPIALFVLTRAVHGVLGALVREDVAAHESAEIEDELTRLIRGFVAAAVDDVSMPETARNSC